MTRFQLAANLGGLTIAASPDTEVIIDVPDFSQPENIIVTLPTLPAFDDILNFNNMLSAAIVY